MSSNIPPPTLPNTPAKRWRIVLCMGQYCNQRRQAESLCDHLTARLGELGPSWGVPAKSLKWEIANCLSMCGAGPNVLVYPDGTAYHHVDDGQLEAIVAELLRRIEDQQR